MIDALIDESVLTMLEVSCSKSCRTAPAKNLHSLGTYMPVKSLYFLSGNGKSPYWSLRKQKHGYN